MTAKPQKCVIQKIHGLVVIVWQYMAKACKLKSKSPDKRIKLTPRTGRLFKSPLAL
jgi:hypothetical protein